MTSMWCNRPNGRSIRLLTVTEATACQAVEHSHDTIQFEAVSARHPSQSRAKTPQALCCRIQLRAQPPHHGTGIDGSPAARLHLHTNHHLQTACRNVGASLIFTIMKDSYSLVLKYLPYSSGGSSVGLHAVLGSVFCFPLFHTPYLFRLSVLLARAKRWMVFTQFRGFNGCLRTACFPRRAIDFHRHAQNGRGQ